MSQRTYSCYKTELKQRSFQSDADYTALYSNTAQHSDVTILLSSMCHTIHSNLLTEHALELYRHFSDNHVRPDTFPTKNCQYTCRRLMFHSYPNRNLSSFFPFTLRYKFDKPKPLIEALWKAHCSLKTSLFPWRPIKPFLGISERLGA